MVERTGKPVGAVVLATAAVVLATGAALLVRSPVATAAPSCELPTFGAGGTYNPHIDPASFSPNVTNELFPLVPGRILVYTGVKDGKKALNLALTTSRTKVVDGVTARVVEDRLYLNNVLEERTSMRSGPDARVPSEVDQIPPTVTRSLRSCP